ncbi:M61 metallopeptidase family protein [Natronorubrum sulfidifaciens]|uniref:Glycyl aminopeptidase n=1 Tax=Natronorubrum sulfidifaciens JCM 14089 TaxID=1230460 RepID=L9WBJ8_9EURY|nr:hypothetical protein [Natronorubrum sulfidifaciens]ELY45683.1 hypothetical protein C495_07880 [Natronorubrum sulfidifaciens JCM 14089]
MTTRVAVVLVVLLLTALPAGVAGAGGSQIAPETDTADGDAASVPSVNSGSTASLSSTNDVLERTTTLRQLPAQPGTFETEMTFDVPESMTALEIDLESEAEVHTAAGFEATDRGTYRWDETTESPTVRFTMPANRTGAIDGHAAQPVAETEAATAPTSDGEGGYAFLETGEWGVVQVPTVGLSYRTATSDPIGIEETVTVDGPGAAGTELAVFGAVTEHERVVDGERIRLVVLEAADLRERPTEILDSLEAASGRLDVGSSATEAVMVAVPSDVDWGSRGMQYGPSDAWVVADAPLETATNVWLHEYVHVRQRFANPDVGTASDSRWLVEAQAEYYAALLAYEQELITFREFRRSLERGAESPASDAVLTEPSTWGDSNADYLKGALVYGDLDRQLRLATEGDRSLDDVFRTLNARDERVSEAEFLEALEAAGGPTVRDRADRYTRTDETPEAWNRFEHRAAFDQPRATIAYGVGVDSIRVSDQPWERWDRADIGSLDTQTADSATDRGVLAVPAGERVTVPVTVENVDTRAGTADATLQVDGKIMAHTQTHLEGGARVNETLSWTPMEPGIHDVRIGSDRLTVVVRSAPSLTVTELQVSPDSVDPGESVTATATVTTSDEYPAAGTLEFRTAAETVSGQPIALAPGETGTVEVDLQFSEDGRYEIVAGGQSTTVTVGGVLGGLESMPGFGGVAGVVALAVVLAIALLGRRR